MLGSECTAKKSNCLLAKRDWKVSLRKTKDLSSSGSCEFCKEMKNWQNEFHFSFFFRSQAPLGNDRNKGFRVSFCAWYHRDAEKGNNYRIGANRIQIDLMVAQIKKKTSIGKMWWILIRHDLDAIIKEAKPFCVLGWNKIENNDLDGHVLKRRTLDGVSRMFEHILWKKIGQF